MDGLDLLSVRFHYNGEFLKRGNELIYHGGASAMSFVDRDKVSLPEIVGHLRDHCNVTEGTLLHWLFPGRDMNTGLRALVDDKVCQYMSDCIVECGVAEVFVEKPMIVEETDGQEDATDKGREFEEYIEASSDDSESEDVDLQPLVIRRQSREKVEKEVALVKQFYSSPSKKGKEEFESDSDYIPGDSCSSGDDDEATQIYRKFKEFKKKVRRGEATSLDDVIFEGLTHRTEGGLGEDEGNCTPYVDTSDEYSEHEGQGSRSVNLYPRYNKKNPVVNFQVGMKFNSKGQFKKAAIKHGLDEHKVIRFVKDDPKRVRAICDWKGCPWVCLLSKTSRSDSWQIATFENNHMCPPRRDNKLVTSARIAKKYEKFIFANPGWKLGHMLQTVQEEMFANVSMSKLKRAKSLVMKKAMDATKGQYSRLYDYQMELLRSNPGSTAVALISTTQQSSTSGMKRKSTSSASAQSATDFHAKKAKLTHNMIKSSAQAKVSTGKNGAGTISLQAKVPISNASCSVHVKVSAGSASGKVRAQEPSRPQKKEKNSGPVPILMLPPWQSDKL